MYSSNRAYEASVYVNGRPVKEVKHRGVTYLEGRKGTDYTLYFKNNRRTRGLGSDRVLVIPSVDGLSVMDGKPAGKNSGGFIVESGKSIEIPGWMVDQSTAAKFTFWPQDARGEQTYIEELSSNGASVDIGNQGMIGFLVIEEHFTPTLDLKDHHSTQDMDTWRQASFDASNYDPAVRGIAIGSSGHGVSQNLNNVSTSNATGVYTSSYHNTASDVGMGTKFGESTNWDTRLGQFNRGKVDGEIVFEYDTLRGLKDRGVPVEFFKGTGKGYGSRSAFPADSNMGCQPPNGWRK